MISTPLAAQTPQANPSPTAPRGQMPRESDAGRQVFTTACRPCHGEEGVGGRGPALRGDKFTVDFVQAVVSAGRPGTLMPTFRDALGPDQIDSVARYVASLQARRTDWMLVRGDAAAGRDLFYAEEVEYSCHNCHSVRGEGGRVGPDLAARLKNRSAREILQRIVVVPHRSADPAYQRVRITTTSGDQYVGIKAGSQSNQALNFYDTASLPAVLRTFRISEIRAISALNGTAMPSDYASRFSLVQLLDLVTFLRSEASGSRPPVTLADLIDDSSGTARRTLGR
jgi:putative heme-binding domain-containing protein